MSHRLRIGIVGAGLIGNKRAEAIARTSEGSLLGVADIDPSRSQSLAEQFGATPSPAWDKLVTRQDIDAVIVAVPNSLAATIVLTALRAGKHVLCEKPLGINSKQAAEIVIAEKKARRLVKVGFNHRFHAAMLKAHEIFENGGIGKILFVRARYGHGGRKGMEREWRFEKDISGGGELLDQGVHLIDLARWFAGDFDRVYGIAQTKFWRTTVDDNAFALMKNQQVTVSFHVSTTNWKNIFSFEVFGDSGYVQVEGKGGSYGEEKLIYGRRKAEFGVPEVNVLNFPKEDKSWENEWLNFTKSVAGKEQISGTSMDGFLANKIVEALYRSSRLGRELKVSSKLTSELELRRK